MDDLREITTRLFIEMLHNDRNNIDNAIDKSGYIDNTIDGCVRMAKTIIDRTELPEEQYNEPEGKNLGYTVIDCPECHSINSIEIDNKYRKEGLYLIQCNACGKHFKAEYHEKFDEFMISKN